MINSLNDGGFYPHVMQRFDHVARPEKNRGLILRIDVEDEEHQNNGQATMEFFTAEILSFTPQNVIPLKTRLWRYFKRRSWHMLAIYFGSLTVVLVTLIQIKENEIILPPSNVFLFQALLGSLPSIAYFISGLNKLKSRFLEDD